MANYAQYLLILLSFHYIAIASTTSPSSNPTTPMNFIKCSCQSTRYPALCIHSLSSFASKIQRSHRQLAQAALAVSLAKAHTATLFISKISKCPTLKPREHQAVKDCIDNMGDTMDQLNQSIREMANMDHFTGQEFMWHMSNVQTWASAALTNENTCLDGFARPTMNGNVKFAIRRRIVGVEKVTSNALALVNRFAARHRGHKAISETTLP